MNGAHCQTSTVTMLQVGACWTKEKASRPIPASTQLSTPNWVLNIWFVHTSPDTTGMTRNGVMSRVRTIPRPGKLRSRSRASAVPTTRDPSTAETVMTTLVPTASRKNPFV